MSESPFAVEMNDVVIRFPGVLANDHVNFTLRQGEIHALLGENGAGKSTLMNVIGCLDIPSGGRYTLDGIDVSQMSQWIVLRGCQHHVWHDQD